MTNDAPTKDVDYVRAQLALPRPPSTAWLRARLIDDFGHDSETADDVIRQAQSC